MSAEDKGTGKSQKITIKNESGRMTQEEIEKMIADAEKFKEEDNKSRERVDAKNDLENYLFTMKSTVNKTDMKMQEEDKKKINDIIQEKLTWLETNTTASTEEFKEIKKEGEEVINPILAAGATGGATGGMGQPPTTPETTTDEPTIEEIIKIYLYMNNKMETLLIFMYIVITIYNINLIKKTKEKNIEGCMDIWRRSCFFIYRSYRMITIKPSILNNIYISILNTLLSIMFSLLFYLTRRKTKDVVFVCLLLGIRIHIDV